MVGLALVCSGCGLGPTSPTSASATSEGSLTPSGPNDVDAELPDPLAYPSDDTASRAAAVVAAEATMAAFLRVDLDSDSWLSGLSEHLSPAARAAYVGTDPLEVPARAITGPAVYEPSTSAYLATVVVSTDVGDYRLLLSREGQGAPWLTETLTPPDNLP